MSHLWKRLLTELACLSSAPGCLTSGRCLGTCPCSVPSVWPWSSAHCLPSAPCSGSFTSLEVEQLRRVS